MIRLAEAGFCIAVIAVTAACATERYENVSAEIVEDCRREVAILTDREEFSTMDPLRGPAAESMPEPIEDARTAREVAGGPGFTSWPEEALMYRCFESRGAELTAEQREMLAEWEEEAQTDRDND